MEFKNLNSIKISASFFGTRSIAAPLTTGNINFLQHWYQSLWNPVASLLNRSIFQLTRIYIWTRAVNAGVPPKKSGCKNGFLLGENEMGQLKLPLLGSMGRFLSYLLVIYFTNQQLTVYRLLTVLERNLVDSSSQKNVYPAFDLHPFPPFTYLVE